MSSDQARRRKPGDKGDVGRRLSEFIEQIEIRLLLREQSCLGRKDIEDVGLAGVELAFDVPQIIRERLRQIRTLPFGEESGPLVSIKCRLHFNSGSPPQFVEADRLLCALRLPLTGERPAGVPNRDIHLRTEAPKCRSEIVAFVIGTGLNVLHDIRTREARI